MKIAILHEMLIKLGGAEKVVENIMNIFPDADIYTLMYDERKVGKIFPAEKIHKNCRKLMSQKLYSFTKKQRLSLPLMKSSVESLDFSTYDRVIVSSSGFAHGLKTGKNTKTIVYYHAPARYMWDWTHEYRKEIHMNTGLKGYFYGKFMKNLRVWDYHAAQRNNVILANSATTSSRIQKYYRRKSQILYPPIETERFAKNLKDFEKSSPFLEATSSEYYIILSALTEFKRLDIAISAFRGIPHANLLIIGAGESRTDLEKLAADSENIKFAGAQYGDDLVSLVQQSSGLIFPGEEDFGIVPIEIMAAGKPVFALNKGGLTETVIAGKTGDFFQSPDGEDFIEKFELFHKNNIAGLYKEFDCKERAAEYDEKLFSKTMKELIA